MQIVCSENPCEVFRTVDMLIDKASRPHPEQMRLNVGVPSCGQRHRNVFIDLLLTCTITNTIINDSLTSPPCASSPAPFSFAHPPTPVLSVTKLRLGG